MPDSEAQVPMLYRRFGKTDLMASAIGFGCNRIADPSRDRAEVLATLQEALERGLNYFDTADVYNRGESERLLGEALRGRRDGVILCSKAGKRHAWPDRVKDLLRPYVRRLRAGSRTGPGIVEKLSRIRPAQNFESAYIVHAVEQSLRRLRTSYLDVFLFHNPSPEVVREGQLFEAAARLTRRGLIRHYGVACGSDLLNSPETLANLLEDPNLVALQMRINVFATTTIERVLPLVSGRGVAVTAFEPLGKGALLGDARIRGASEENAGRTAAELALRFVLDQAAVSVVLVGMTNRRHLAENLAALDAPALTAGELAGLSSAT
jgi:aryl-alcohol dehydrogenase-like predicted oxidoreductase